MFEGELSQEGASEDRSADYCPFQQPENGDTPGKILITGGFYCRNRKEILSLAYAVEKRQRGSRPHDRILAIQDNGRSATITTTGTNLPRRIASALSYAYQGQVTFKYDRDLDRVRVTWSR